MRGTEKRAPATDQDGASTARDNGRKPRRRTRSSSLPAPGTATARAISRCAARRLAATGEFEPGREKGLSRLPSATRWFQATSGDEGVREMV